jgi:tetratricopeptide (TPR) repeat protein/nucleotide-binding universal stress UspA family protein
VNTFSSFRFRRIGLAATLLGVGVALALSMAVQLCAETPAEAGQKTGERGRILLVLPFENRTGQPSLEWMREASAQILSSRLESAGFAPMSRAERMYALDHLGLPQAFHPSRASSLKLAETLDADSIVVGSYVTDGTGVIAEAQLVDVPHLRMSEAVTARGEMRSLISVFDSLAWKLTRQLDPGFKVSEEAFVAAGSNLRLDAFEQYIRGITQSDKAERLRHLNQSVVLNPEFSPAWMALGREQYADQKYEQAAAAFAKVVRTGGDDALEAGFFRGLSLLFSGDYAHAEESFAGVARVLPLAEVLNNQGVALARGGKDGIPLFRQAVATDPSVADYHFSLAVSLRRHGDNAEALTELAQCLRLHPNDSEAQAVQKTWTGVAKPAAAKAPVVHPAIGAEKPAASAEVAGSLVATDAKPDPLERIERKFDASAFHQAALMVEEVDAQRIAALPPRERAEKLSAQAHDYLERGLLLEAERLYQEAVAADNKVSAAHAGVAELRERAGDAKAARKEAVTSLELLPSVDAYLILVRLDIAANHLDEAQVYIVAALQIDPQNKAALELREEIKAQREMKR